jgi:16S rRNA (uracil1498-N3)-methyltransferase
MTAQRFYTPQPLCAGSIVLPAATVHHLRVLRLRVGDAVQLFNGLDAFAWDGVIADLADKAATVLLHAPAAFDAGMELPFDITVAQSLVEPSKMDWVVEKAVELGVARVQPVAAARSVTRLDADRAAKRTAHWQAIALAASEQCGRNRVMQLAAPVSVAAALTASTGVHLLLHPVGGVPLQAWCAAHAAQPVTLWIGPEGGWAKQELAQLEGAGADRVTFGARVLRTESAAAAIAAALQALWCKP